jgi:uncharacterized repeat protein (TIGR01451 family)
VLNQGPDPATNVRIEVLLPFGASLIENTLTGLPGAGTVPGRCFTEPAGAQRTTVICEYPTLLVGEMGSTRFLVLIDPDLPSGTQLSFDSIASSEVDDLDGSNNNTSIEFDTNTASDLTVTKVGTPNPVIAGQNANYHISLKNNGSSLARNVEVHDALSTSGKFLKLVSANFLGDPDGACYLENFQSPDVQCGLGDVPPGRTVDIDLALSVAPSTPDATTLSNAITVTGELGIAASGDLTEDLTVGTLANLSIDNAVSDPMTRIGSEVTYTVTVQNFGPSDAQSVQVVDTLAAQVAYLVDTAGCVEGPPGTLTCNLGTLAAGESRSFDILARILGDAAPCELFTNTAMVSSTTPDPDAANNSATANALPFPVAGGCPLPPPALCGLFSPLLMEAMMLGVVAFAAMKRRFARRTR